MAWLRLVDPRLLLDLLFATGLGVVVLGRVTESRTLWLLRGYLFLVALAWVVQRYANLPLTTKLVDALVLACSLALAILWQGELRRLMELLGTGRLDVLFGNSGRDGLASGSVAVLSEAAGRLSQSRRGALVLVDLGSDLRPEDFLNPGIPLDAQLSVDLLLNLFAADTPAARWGRAGARQPDHGGGGDPAALTPGQQPLRHPPPGGPGHHRALRSLPLHRGVGGNGHPVAGLPGAAGAADHQQPPARPAQRCPGFVHGT